jgi:multidrug transporter EmrE-like cation transporter
LIAVVELDFSFAKGISAAQTVDVACGAAAVAVLGSVAVLCIATGKEIAYVLGWPTWAGYGIAAILVLGCAFVLSRYGRGRLNTAAPVRSPAGRTPLVASKRS